VTLFIAFDKRTFCGFFFFTKNKANQFDQRDAKRLKNQIVVYYGKYYHYISVDKPRTVRY